jgi:hypothetical protein
MLAIRQFEKEITANFFFTHLQIKKPVSRMANKKLEPDSSQTIYAYEISTGNF